MRARHGLVAAALALGLVLIPVGVAPAQAAQTLKTFGCISTIDPKCAGANLPILAEAGIISGGGATAATGATAAVAGTGAAGTLGFGTLVGASGAAVGLGMLKLYGVDPGMYIDTDPAYGGGGPTITGLVGAVYETAATGGYKLTIDTVESTGSLFTATGTLERYASGSANYPWNLWCFRASDGQILSASVPVAPRSGNTVSFSYTCPAGSVPYTAGMGSPVTVAPTAGQWWYDTPSARWWPDEGATGYPKNWRWFSPDSPLGIGDPQGYHGTIRTRLECIAPGWTAPTTIVSAQRIDVEQGGRIPVPPATCDPPSVAKTAVVEYQADGTSSWVPVGSGDASATVTTLVDDYPSCFSSTGATLCELQLQRTANGTTWDTCGPLAEYCPTWVTEWSETPDLFRCRFGPYTVDMTRCSAFRQPGLLLPNVGEDADADGKPDPVSPTAPVPEQLPNPVQDSTTGEPVPLPTDVPGADDQPRECWPSGFGIFNPLSWVLMPIRCAFEPSPQKVQQFRDGLRDKWEGSTPGLVVGGITAAVGAAGAVVVAGGCSGIQIPTGWLNRDAFSDAGFPASFTILDACPGSPLQPWAAFSFLLISGSMIVLAVRVVPGMVGKLVNYGGVSG